MPKCPVLSVRVELEEETVFIDIPNIELVGTLPLLVPF
jgi:hypothetical protein